MLKHKIFNILLLVLIYGLSLPAWGAPTVQRRTRVESVTRAPHLRPTQPAEETLVCSCVICNQDGYPMPVTFSTGMPLFSSQDHNGMCMHDLKYMPVILGDWKCNGGPTYITPSCP